MQDDDHQQSWFLEAPFVRMLTSLKRSHLRGGFQFLLILDLWGISFHAVVVFGLVKELLFESVLGRCDQKEKPIGYTKGIVY